MKNIFLKDSLSKEAIAALIEVIPHKKETIMTAAQQLETRGEKRGIRQGIQQGMQQGMERGMQQGMEKGMQQGIQQGMERGMYTRSLEIAKNMLYKLHLDTTAVSKVTGLSQAELSNLQE